MSFQVNHVYRINQQWGLRYKRFYRAVLFHKSLIGIKTHNRKDKINQPRQYIEVQVEWRPNTPKQTTTSPQHLPMWHPHTKPLHPIKVNTTRAPTVPQVQPPGKNLKQNKTLLTTNSTIPHSHEYHARSLLPTNINKKRLTRHSFITLKTHFQLSSRIH